MSMSDQHDGGRYDPGFGYGLPITAVRGGIKYPTPTKETHTMTERMTKSEIEAELKVNEGLMSSLMERRNQLKCGLKTALPDAPPDGQSLWCIDVRFAEAGSLYQFAVLRVGGVFYTTGAGKNARFNNWRRFLEWLDEAVEHSALIPQVSDYDTPAPLEGKGR